MLSEKLLEMKLVKCSKCGATLEDGGWGEDEYGPYQSFICPNAQSHKNEEEKVELKPVEVVAPLKLDLGCGKNKKPGFIGVDTMQFDGVDVVLDLARIEITKPGVPIYAAWPWGDDTVGEVHSSHFLEHLTGEQRIHFFNELYRVLQKDAKATIITPHWRSGRAYGDLTHQWPPVVEFFWYYLDKNWRAANAPHLALNCDFACTWGYSLAHPWNLKNQEAQGFALNHYAEVAQDMICTAAARK